MWQYFKKKSKALALGLISFYQSFISPLLRPSCVFSPTCSEYTRLVIERHGVLKGIRLGALRIIRCHPWQKNRFDPAP